jgi:hypothetical protein
MIEDPLPPTFVRHMSAAAPAVLYHYTDQAGLIGITTTDTELGTAQLWATKIQYMNDATEFGLAISIARESLRKKLVDRRKIPLATESAQSTPLWRTRLVESSTLIYSLAAFARLVIFSVSGVDIQAALTGTPLASIPQF